MHTHLKRDQRITLGALRRAGHNQSFIADQLGVHRSTISRELKRNRMKSGKYHAWNADVQAQERRKQSKVQYRKIDAVLGSVIEQRLSPLVSPETVAHEERFPALDRSQGKAAQQRSSTSLCF